MPVGAVEIVTRPRRNSNESQYVGDPHNGRAGLCETTVDVSLKLQGCGNGVRMMLIQVNAVAAIEAT